MPSTVDSDVVPLPVTAKVCPDLDAVPDTLNVVVRASLTNAANALPSAKVAVEDVGAAAPAEPPPPAPPQATKRAAAAIAVVAEAARYV